ncbi:MAG TPA: hypothetical protein VLW26_01105 [Steroidobacteraceae bacterium]|nr:hypothetical protein [Steroidobacteraceae bacterium]
MSTNVLEQAPDWRLLAAANDEGTASFSAPVASGLRAVSTGWDPYEVWRTRIKPLKTHAVDSAGRAALT